jgi:hypothetical protein
LALGPETRGVWGGTTTRDRAKIRRERRLAAFAAAAEGGVPTSS